MSAERLSAEDARILALEAGTVRGHTCKVIVFGGERTAAAVRAHLSQRLDAVPRLRERLAAPPAPLAWVDDPSFSLERHVVDRGPADDAGLRRLIAELMAEPLARDRPLWAMDVVSPLAAGRTVLVWRIHHALADGVTAMRMAHELLLEPGGEEPRRRASEPAQRPPSARTPSAVAAVRTAARLPATLRRELRRRGSASPLDRPAGPRREVAFIDAPLDELRRIGHAAPERATVNDVVLAAVAAGLRGWLEQLGAPAEGLRVQVPVSLHVRDEQDVANRDSFIVIDLPLEQSDPRERLVAVARETRERKRRHDAQTLDVFFGDLSHLSRSLERLADRWVMSPRVFTLNVSDVPGPGGPQLVLGAPLLELHSLAEIAHRHALRVAVVSAAERISFGLCADPDAVGGLEPIAEGIGREINALGAAVGVTSSGRPVGVRQGAVNGCDRGARKPVEAEAWALCRSCLTADPACSPVRVALQAPVPLAPASWRAETNTRSSASSAAASPWRAWAAPQSLRNWMRQTDVERGRRGGLTSAREELRRPPPPRTAALRRSRRSESAPRQAIAYQHAVAFTVAGRVRHSGRRTPRHGAGVAQWRCPRGGLVASEKANT